MHKPEDTAPEDTIENAVDPEETAQSEEAGKTEEAQTQQSDETDNKYNELLDKYQRSLAEFDNYRKRTMKEKAAMYDDGVREAIEKLLPAIDNFERAMTAAGNKEDNFYKGIEMIYRQLATALQDLGVTPIPCLGETFNPALHNAIAHVEDEAYGENAVIEELQKGYQYKDKVIRHAMVKVAN